jgi:Fic family protein
MKFEEFVAGRRRQQYQYKDFLPSPVNHECGWDDPRINVLLEQAVKALGELNAFSLSVPDVDRFIHMHVVKEANTSSRIEGTKTEIEDDILPEEEVLPERREDWREVRNYVRALNEAIRDLETLPLSLRLLRKAHVTLMDGVRGERKTPGEFRTSQNWIGGASLADAAFIPPHHDDLGELLGDLEKFWHNDAVQVPQLIRIAISHYQFETIHPFLDGNGRIGRLLITLFMVSQGLLSKPSLYLSAHLEKHRTAYFGALDRVRESNDMGHWCRFFLTAVIETATKGCQTFRDIVSLRSRIEGQVVTLGRRAESAHVLMGYLYETPVTTVNGAAQLLDCRYPAANTLIGALCDLGILKELTGYRRNRIFLFTPYLEIFRDLK